LSNHSITFLERKIYLVISIFDYPYVFISKIKNNIELKTENTFYELMCVSYGYN